MPNFESGVASYIHGRATVDVFFPVDHKGNADICCRQCFFYRTSSFRCSLNGEVCSEPNKYVGACCPLTMMED